MFNLFKRQTVSQAASQLGRENARQYKERVRAKCDEMRKEMGLEPARWPK